MVPVAVVRTVRYVNIVIAALLVAALAAVWWYAWRPLPRTSGVVNAPVGRPVQVAFDSLAVPHVAAASLEDALFAQGYLTAQERLWQMDSLRRLAAGELAEIVGASALEADREARRLRMRRIAERAYVAMPAGDRAAMAAYARGVNHFIDTHRGRLSLEFTLLAYQPRPWSVVDSILVGLQMHRTLSSTWKGDLARRRMLAGGDPTKVRFLFPARIGTEELPGSNAWVLGGTRTASGKPLLASDPHLEYSLPGIWFMVHLRAPGLNVSGVSLPGVPGVTIGHNDRIAWGITNLGFDVQDLYLEEIDERTGRYRFQGATEQARAEREVIRVKGAPSQEVLIWVTRHGPLFVTEGDRRMSLRWSAAEPGGIAFPLLDLNRARDWREFTAALERFAGPGSNFVYADVDGNIGYHAAGKLPVRAGFSGEVPVDGASGQFEWQGYIPFDRLPAAYNPPSGIIVTANQNPFPAGYPYAVGGAFSPPLRAHQIRAMLCARNGWRAADMPVLQKDVYSAFSHYLARSLTAAWEQRHRTPELREAVDMLRSWNGQMEHRLAASFLITLAYEHVRRAAGESASRGKGLLYEDLMAPAVIERLLRTRPAGWFRDYDEMLLGSLAGAVEEGRRMQGRDMQRWKYGRYRAWLLANPVVQRVPWLGRYFAIGPVPMSGSATTVKQTGRRLGPSMRMTADLADWDRSLMNIVAGQSGHVLSRHFKDQWPHYYTGESFPMRFRNLEAEPALRFDPQ